MSKIGQKVCAALLAAFLSIFSGCNGDPSGLNTPLKTLDPSGTETPIGDLRVPGAARKALNDTISVAGIHPVLKVEITKNRIEVAFLIDSKARTFRWENDTVTEVISSTEYFGQSSFNPNDFNIDDLGALFSTAADKSGSSSSQMLQIVEFNQGQVLMTVTTNPETLPVFFRQDGTVIEGVEMTTLSGVKQALEDVIGSHSQIITMGFDSKEGLWIEAPGPKDGTIIRRTRPINTPAFEVPRKGNPEAPTFNPSQIRPEVLTRLINGGVRKADGKVEAVSFTISVDPQLGEPVIRLNVNGQVTSYELSGIPVTIH